MEEDKSPQRTDYFGTFLETVQSGQSAETRDPSTALADPLSMQLVQILEDGPHDTTYLQRRLGVDLLTFSKTLEAMTEARFVDLRGEAGNETVELTDDGAMLATVHRAQAPR
jgi:hypothetical protein